VIPPVRKIGSRAFQEAVVICREDIGPRKLQEKSMQRTGLIIIIGNGP
jgi:hypothetical protein